ncbi:MAG: hypothetical protein N0C84_00705 [Candidatus Thiodiazotropha taylori]|uniref:Uncharacterized protein n=1 Tax=Candidatus Thiodiazotropha taylori TaxID=2792791 RepID=A0A9E4N349_9GAMM|nr:hypothetical protein [Candidatus Thiodiazotropha taylori]MCW4254965.1 hypothetical protein [Candidatus Thiodiazotropha taylori]
MIINSVPHQDYDNLDTLNEMFLALCHLSVKDAFDHLDISVEDISYGNDVCPSVGIIFPGDEYIQVHVDYKDYNARELEGVEFNITHWKDDEVQAQSSSEIFETAVNLVRKMLEKK